MKLLIVCIVSWLVGLLAYLGYGAAVYRQSISSRDLVFVVVWSGAAFAFACIAVYLPVLMGMQRLLGGVRPAWPFPLVSMLLGVAPTAFMLFSSGGNLRSLASAEASLFYAMFSAAGILLGLGYVRIQRPAGALIAGVVVFLVLIVLFGPGMRHVLAQEEGPAELISRLGHEDLGVRFEAAYALASLGADARPAVPALIEMLRSDDHDTAEMATLVLARIAPDPAVEPAVPLLIETVQGLEKGWTAQMNAAVALLRLGREEETARAVVRDELYLSLLLPLLRDRHPVNRLHVCEILMFAGLPRQDILDRLRKTAAEDADARVREAAAKALAQMEH